jgi:hypothetical protein
MLNNESNYAEIIDFLEGMTNRQIRDYNSLELLPMNTVMSILNENLDNSIKLWSQSLPNTSISPIRGIGTQTQSIDKQNLRFKVFNIIGFGFSDGSELSICSDGSNGLEIVSFKLANDKKGLGLDKLVFELFLSFCLKSILYIPSILITIKQNHPHYNSVLDFFLKFDFQKIRVEDGIVTLRKKVKYFSSED